MNVVDCDASVNKVAQLMIDAPKIPAYAKEFLKNLQTESPPAYDSQSNGGTGTANRMIRGLFRTLKLCLEARIGHYVQVNHSLVPWLLQHTCTLLNARARGSDGLTARECTKGTAFNKLVF